MQYHVKTSLTFHQNESYLSAWELHSTIANKFQKRSEVLKMQFHEPVVISHSNQDRRNSQNHFVQHHQHHHAVSSTDITSQSMCIQMATYLSQGKPCLKLAHLVLKSNLPLMTAALLGSNQLRPPSVLHSIVRPGNATFVTRTPLTTLKKQT